MPYTETIITLRIREIMSRKAFVRGKHSAVLEGKKKLSHRKKKIYGIARNFYG